MGYVCLLAVLAGYFLGNLNGAVSISVLFEHEDVRINGSGNAGFTNFVRNYGGWNTLLVLLVDSGKTLLACALGGALLAPFGWEAAGKMLGAVGVVLGHDFPALLGFHGGKGILSSLAAAVMIDWRIALIILGVFVLFYLPTQLVSLGSVMAALAFSVSFGVLWHENLPVMLGGIFLGLLAVFMHRTNISRLIKGTETKTALLNWRRKK